MKDFDLEHSPDPATGPAPLGPRILAGTVDTAAIILLSTAFIVGATVLTGGSLPLLAIFVTVLIWSVAPLTAFGATAGMALFGIRLASRDGDRLDLLEILFREMIGRGWFPVAYLGTLIVGFVGSVTGRASFTLPVGLSLFVAAIAAFIVVLATLGHINILTDAQGRGLADLMAKTLVTPRRRTPPVVIDPEVEDPLDREWARMRRVRRLRAFVVAELLLLGVVVGVPPLMAMELPGIDPRSIDTSALEIEGLQRRFSANQASAAVADELVEALEIAGRFEEAQEIRERHEAAVAAARQKREAFLRSALERDPTDWEVFSLLVEFLDEEERLEDAREVYAAYVERDGTPEVRAGYGIWLYRRDLNEEAVVELERAIAEHEQPSGRLHAFLGLAARDLGRLEEAKAAFERALELDPELDRTRGYLAEVEAALAAPLTEE
ncbi:MAG: RDD family protein [Deltaproteobacteria bacterium]|nr:RDD family protein [Deltaproteobacteria bacterium]